MRINNATDFLTTLEPSKSAAGNNTSIRNDRDDQKQGLNQGNGCGLPNLDHVMAAVKGLDNCGGQGKTQGVHGPDNSGTDPLGRWLKRAQVHRDQLS